MTVDSGLCEGVRNWRILFGECEEIDPAAIDWILLHGGEWVTGKPLSLSGGGGAVERREGTARGRCHSLFETQPSKHHRNRTQIWNNNQIRNCIGWRSWVLSHGGFWYRGEQRSLWCGAKFTALVAVVFAPAFTGSAYATGSIEGSDLFANRPDLSDSSENLVIWNLTASNEKNKKNKRNGMKRKEPFSGAERREFVQYIT